MDAIEAVGWLAAERVKAREKLRHPFPRLTIGPLYRGAKRAWFQRPHLAISVLYDDRWPYPQGQAPSFSFCIFGLLFTYQGRRTEIPR